MQGEAQQREALKRVKRLYKGAWRVARLTAAQGREEHRKEMHGTAPHCNAASVLRRALSESQGSSEWRRSALKRYAMQGPEKQSNASCIYRVHGESL